MTSCNFMQLKWIGSVRLEPIENEFCVSNEGLQMASVKVVYNNKMFYNK